MKARLSKIQHDAAPRKLWCGPACLSSVSGRPTSHIYHLINLHIERSRVCHMSLAEMQTIGMHLGLRLTPLQSFRYPNWHTVLHFMRSPRPPEHTYLVGTPDHWFLADRNLCQDNHNLFPVPYNKFHMKKSYVEEVVLVEDLGYRMELKVRPSRYEMSRYNRHEAPRSQ